MAKTSIDQAFAAYKGSAPFRRHNWPMAYATAAEAIRAALTPQPAVAVVKGVPLYPIPALCPTCHYLWVGVDAIGAPSLANCWCCWCGGKVGPITPRMWRWLEAEAKRLGVVVPTGEPRRQTSLLDAA